MGLLPFDDWIYNLPYMRDEVNSKHDAVVKTQDAVQADVLAFNKQLDKYKLLLVNNSILLYVSTTVQMDDLKLADFTTQIDALPAPVKGDTVLNGAQGGSELFGGIKVLKFVVNLGKLAKNTIAGTAEDMADGSTEKLVEALGEDALDAGVANEAEADAIEPLENAGGEVAQDVTEATVENATSATLASTGIGIFAAVGIDAIFGAINGAKEKDQLQKILDQLDAKMQIVDKFLSTVQGKAKDISDKTTEGITTFKNVVTAMKDLLPKGHGPKFSVDFPSTLESLDDCLAAQQKAIDQFSLLTQMRETYVKVVKKRPNDQKDKIKHEVIENVALTAPDWATKKILTDMWDEVLDKYSELMRQAK